jgi:hypothetical protein
MADWQHDFHAWGAHRGLDARIRVADDYVFRHRAIAGLAYMVWIDPHRQWRENKLDAEDWVWFIAVPILGYVILLTAAVEVWLHARFDLETVAIAMILSLAIGIRNAWDLVVFMAQQPRT